MTVKKIMTVTEGAERIDQVAQNWMDGSSKESIYVVTRRAACRLSADPIFNLAAYMKYEYGSSLSGGADENWLLSAKQANKILVNIR